MRDIIIAPLITEKVSHLAQDGKTYVFNLRKDVKFNDGEKFNAEVAKLNFEAILTNINRHK